MTSPPSAPTGNFRTTPLAKLFSQTRCLLRMFPLLRLERPAHCKPEGAARLKVVQAARILQYRLDLLKNRRIALIRMQWIGQPQGLASAPEGLQIDPVERSNDGFVHAQGVVGPIHAERRLHDRQIDIELDARGTP